MLKLGIGPKPLVAFRVLCATWIMAVVWAAIGAGEPIAEWRSKGVVAGSSVHPVVESFELNSTEIVDIASYTAEGYHQCSDALGTLTVGSWPQVVLKSKCAGESVVVCAYETVMCSGPVRTVGEGDAVAG